MQPQTRKEPIVLPNEDQVRLLATERRAFRSSEVDQALIETGLFETGHPFKFRCPLCGRVEGNDQRMEPMCTGPSWTDDHPPEVMILIES